jgi:hypothetical protein
MIRKLSQRADGRRRATVAVVVAVCLVGLMGVAAVVLDGGVLQDDHCRLQAAADAAALAAAEDLFQHYTANNGLDPSGTAATSARTVASADGYTDGSNATVTVNIPPTSGNFVGKAGYAEIIISTTRQRYFSRISGTAAIPVSARAVARGAWLPVGDGIIVLDKSAKGALNAHGNGNMNVNGAPVVVNSSDLDAAIGNGSSAVLTAPAFDVTGNYTTSGGAQFVGTMDTGTRPIPDPLRFLPVPIPNNLPTGSMSTVAPSSSGTVSGTASSGTGTSLSVKDGFYFNSSNSNSHTSSGNGNGNGSSSSSSSSSSGSSSSSSSSTGSGSSGSSGGGNTYYLQPGVFVGGLKFGGQDSVVMAPGIYYMEGGGFSFSGQGSLTGTGVMIYNAAQSNSDNFTITGQGTVNLTPPTSGPYAGLLVFQDRTASAPVQISGNGYYNITGGVYAADALVQISGNGDTSIGSQYISRTLDIGGNGGLNITWNPKQVPSTRIVSLVE